MARASIRELIYYYYYTSPIRDKILEKYCTLPSLTLVIVATNLWNDHTKMVVIILVLSYSLKGTESYFDMKHQQNMYVYVKIHEYEMNSLKAEEKV